MSAEPETLDDLLADDLRAKCDAGLYLQAFTRIANLPPLPRWRGTQSRLLAGRLAWHLGAQRQGDALLLGAWRRSPGSVDAFVRAVIVRLQRRGPYAGWRMLRRGPAPASAAEEAEILALRSGVLGVLRDFASADQAVARARALRPDEPWILLAEARLRELQDRYDDALQLARRAHAMAPRYGPAVSLVAHLLHLCQRDGEALDLLCAALGDSEIGYVALHAATALREAGRHAEAEAALRRAEELQPLAEPALRTHFAGERFELAYHLGRIDEALRVAAGASPFHRRQAENLARAPADEGPLVCPVPFVRQHHMTCGPATLTALALSFDVSTDHLAVVHAICYGGTHDYAERRWALDNGLHAREFRLTVPAARTLLARGIPFAVATTEIGSGHLQAVMGHDPRRDVFVVRDPWFRQTREWLAEEFLAAYRSSGPRAMAIVPVARAAELDALTLPDAALYDAVFAVNEALRAHDHARALAIHHDLAAAHEGHALVIHSRWILSGYERDSVGAFACIERLLELFPDDARLVSRRVSVLRDLGRRDERLAALEAVAGQPGAHPRLRLELAQELDSDARAHRRRDHLLRRALRAAPTDAAIHHAVGNALWGQHQRDEALAHYRFAACLDEVSEPLALAYFRASRVHDCHAEALALLQAREARYRGRSAAPAITLYRALDELHRTREGKAVLDAALAARPRDGDLLLFLAELRAVDDAAQADVLLERARGTVNEVARLTVAARVAWRRGDLELALRAWREVAAREPLHAEAHDHIAALLQVREGRAEAIAHLREVAATFPFVREMRSRLARALGSVEPAEAAVVLRELLETDPSDAWARRDLVLRLLDLGQNVEALAEAELACAIEPASAAGHGIRAMGLRAVGRNEDAADALRAAIRHDVDYTFAVHELIRVAPTPTARDQALEFVYEQLGAQRGGGEAVPVLFVLARDFLAPERRRTWLAWLRVHRPELWQARVQEVGEASVAGEHDLACTLARQLAADFPLLPRAYCALAQACRHAGDAAGEASALDAALDLSPLGPGWSSAAERRGELLRAAGQHAAARALAERAAAVEPLEPRPRLALARAHLGLGDGAAAEAACRAALRVAPEHGEAWALLAEIAQGRGDGALLDRVARELARMRPHDADLWRLMAEHEADLDRRLAALAEARRRDPLEASSYDLAAELLTEAGRFAEADAVLASFPRSPAALELRGRRAWLLAQRGDLAGAVDEMEAVLADAPLYTWGWQRLCDWLEALQRWPEVLAAAEALLRAEPGSAYAHGYHADALLHAGRREEGKAALARALRLDPRYVWAAGRLIDVQLADGSQDLAEATAQDLARHLPGPVSSYWQLHVAARRGDEPRARALLSDLLRDATTPDHVLLEITAELKEVGMLLAADRAASELVTSPDAHRLVGRLWLEKAVAERRWYEAGERLCVLVERRERFAPAAEHVAEAMGKTRSARALHRLLGGPLRSALQADTDAWGMVGWALSVADGSRAATRWFAGWQARSDGTPWILLTIGSALRHLGREAEAHAAAQRALELPADRFTPMHAAWLAADAMAAGDAARARELLAVPPRPGESSYYANLRSLVRAWLIRIVEGFVAGVRALRRAWAQTPADDRDRAMRRVARRVAARIGRGAGVRGVLWRFARLGA